MLGRPRQDLNRADRILDAAADLLVRLGYRKVTIEDIAQQVGIGKGTVYLHWRTKQQLFEALLLREAITYIDKLLDALRGDPSTVLPHRLMAASFLIIHDRPVLRAMFTGDVEQLQTRMADSAMRSHELLATTSFLDLLIRHGLFRADVPNPAYALSAIHGGFLLLDNLDPAAAELDVQARADALAHVVQASFEPTGRPDPRTLAAAASEIMTVFENVIPPYREWIYGYQRTPESG
ncbi:AcrR family transcriptional regulator [Streptosporangium album]|uniref:AcrR family transcriptional regulator n=1 Tax=Streptosporangium album TaxID=47479 RepID=A0A7W7WEJ4_9ACTN|nr:TetR/AcrR family transcriptional regulator [Streptosporangium album]MBB4943454.1 AcrR family transcriptional regulator [Streptosporangium album]